MRIVSTVITRVTRETMEFKCEIENVRNYSHSTEMKKKVSELFARCYSDCISDYSCAVTEKGNILKSIWWGLNFTISRDAHDLSILRTLRTIFKMLLINSFAIQLFLRSLFSWSSWITMQANTWITLDWTTYPLSLSGQDRRTYIVVQ